jgi:hypothetical protein
MQYRSGLQHNRDPLKKRRWHQICEDCREGAIAVRVRKSVSGFFVHARRCRPQNKGASETAAFPSLSFVSSLRRMKESNPQQSVAIVFAVAFCSLILLNSQESVGELEFRTVRFHTQQTLTVERNWSTDSAAESSTISPLSTKPIANFLLDGAQKAGTLAGLLLVVVLFRPARFVFSRASDDCPCYRYNSFSQLSLSQTGHMRPRSETWVEPCEF